MTTGSSAPPPPSKRREAITVDANGARQGRLEILAAHEPPGTLHEAVSLQLFSTDGALLVQQRSATKALFAGRWANTCCTHATLGETHRETATRRIREELGLDVVGWQESGSFQYRAADPVSGLVEHELDYVLFAVGVDRRVAVDPDPAEVAAHEWLPFDEAISRCSGPLGAPWAARVIQRAADYLPR